MRKVFIGLLVILVLLTGCTSSDNKAMDDVNSLKDTIDKQEQKIKELESENAELKTQLDNIGEFTDASTEDDVDKGDKPINEDNIDTIEVGDVITTDKMEITIKKIELTYDVLPDDTSGVYTHYPAESGNVYIHIDTDVKNLQKQDLPCEDIMSVKADYNNGFAYDSMTVPEDSSTGFTYANITSIKPLETLGVRFLIECPQEVDETDNPLILYFSVDKQIFEHVIR